MRDRLIELLNFVQCKAECCSALDGGRCGDLDHLDRCQIETIADHLLANGIIVPPCKVGETVYLLKFNTVIMCKVETIYCGVGIYLRLKPCYQPYVGNRSIYYKVAASRFGKTVFSSAEEAERALKERDDK